MRKENLEKRIKQAYHLLEKCRVCPRQCGVNRLKGEGGFCRVGERPVISSYHPHFGEESCLVGSRGSGTIFFTHCNLACVYCQNYDISQLAQGEEITTKRLGEIMLELQEMGCHNINLVSPTPYLPQILKSLPQDLNIPIIYNTNAYDRVEALKLLNGIIDIYMPDAKYSDDRIAMRYSMVPNYFEVMKKAIKEMHRQVGDLVISKDGIAQKGLLVRHLVLPNNLAGTKKIMQFLAQEVSKNTFVNIMAQYRPCYKAFEYSCLSRPITKEEHREAVKIAREVGLKRII